jgi:hypothetical protein
MIQLPLDGFHGEQWHQADERTHFERQISVTGRVQNVVVKLVVFVPEADSFAADVVHGRGDAEKMLEEIEQLPGFKARLEWYLANRPDLCSLISRWHEPGMGERRLVALTRGHRMKCLLRRMLDPEEFLSDYGVRSLSKFHQAHPYSLTIRGEEKIVSYEPGESQSAIFGGNSNWRGPVWFPINYLLIESLQQFHHYYGDDFKVECPTRSGNFLTLRQIADELSNRLIKLWLRDENGERPFERAFGKSVGEADSFPGTTGRTEPRYLFHEYFHGDTGAGLGASHQTGWTALVAKLIRQQGEFGTITK